MIWMQEKVIDPNRFGIRALNLIYNEISGGPFFSSNSVIFNSTSYILSKFETLFTDTTLKNAKILEDSILNVEKNMTGPLIDLKLLLLFWLCLTFTSPIRYWSSPFKNIWLLSFLKAALGYENIAIFQANKICHVLMLSTLLFQHTRKSVFPSFPTYIHYLFSHFIVSLRS